jgi:hypothetical protein
MTENGDPCENAIAERINGILKTEWIYDCKPDLGTVAFVGRIIDLYNNQRPHQSIGYMAPAFVHQTGLKTERKRKNYYRSASKPDEEPCRPIKEEAKVLQHGHSASAPLHSHAASRETNRKQKCKQKE